jgi:hypothetical protein
MMQKNMRGAAGAGPGWLAMSLMGLGLLVSCLLVGLLAAVVPPGALVRLLAVPGGIVAIILLWAMPKRELAPDGAMNLLMLALLALINLWPAYLVYRFGGLPSVNPTKLAWLSFLAYSGFHILASRQPLTRLGARCKAHPWLVTCILFLFVWRVISAACGIQPVAQVLSLGSEIISCYLAFFFVLAVLRDERDVFRLLTVLVVVAAIQALLASYETVVKHTLFDRFISLSAEDSAAMLDTLREKFRDGRYRAQGTFEHPMVLAEYMAMMAPLAVVLFLNRLAGRWRWVAAGFLPLALAVIVSSRSRVGIAVLMGAMLLVGLLMMMPRGARARGGASSLSLVVSLFMLPLLLIAAYYSLHELLHLISGRSTGEANSTMTRVLMMERGIPLLKASPLVGYGNGMGPVKLGFFDGVRFNIDNYWLGMALDAGVPGLLAFVAVFALGALLGLRYYRQRDDRAGLAAGMLAIAVIILLACKTVLSISSGFTLAYVLIAAIIVLGESPAPAPAAHCADPAGPLLP